jgi:hypothetical protein
MLTMMYGQDATTEMFLEDVPRGAPVAYTYELTVNREVLTVPLSGSVARRPTAVVHDGLLSSVSSSA